MPLIELRDVSMRYENQLAVEHVSASIEPGDYVLIVGENGSGKSTLLKGILGLMPLSGGELIMGEGLQRTGIGYLPQRSETIRGFPASVREVVRSGCLPRLGRRPFFSGAENRLALDAMRKLGIEALSRTPFGELSGGQQQRVLLARALCATENLLLLDEPMAALDPIATKELYEQIRMLNKQHGVAILMVSHDVGGALRDATKVLCMHQTMAFFGTASEFLKTHYHDELTGGEHHHG